jgi:hypothetical protein
MSSNKTLKELEQEYNWASSSICKRLPKLLILYMGVLEAMVINPWPTPQEFQRENALLAEPLLTAGVALIVDTTKVSNVDSVYVDTAGNHHNHKGFGLTVNVMTDMHGNMLDVQVNIDGNTGDVPAYRRSDPYLSLNNKIIPIQYTALGDGGYAGRVSSQRGSKNLVCNLTGPERAGILHGAMHLQQALEAQERIKRRNRQPVECAIRVMKKSNGTNVISSHN